MKRLMISMFFCLVTVYLYGQDFFMYVDGKKRTFEVSETKMLVKSEALDAEGIKNAMQIETPYSVKNVYELHNRLTMVDTNPLS